MQGLCTWFQMSCSSDTSAVRLHGDKAGVCSIWDSRGQRLCALVATRGFKRVKDAVQEHVHSVERSCEVIAVQGF